MWYRRLPLLLLFAALVAGCFEPSPAFPPPDWKHLGSELKPAFAKIETRLQEVFKHNRYDNTSYSVEITSASETLWGHYGTARKQNATRPGTKHVDSLSQYRIASISKVFTVLGLLHQQKAGNLDLDTPVINFIGELQSDEYHLPWKDVTLRILASQLSGLPREIAQNDLVNGHIDPGSLGLPPAPKYDAPNCDDFPPCNRSQILDGLKKSKPLFAPNQRSTYSNLNFVLLGMALANVSNTTYEDYIDTSILNPLNMTSSSFTTPSDDHAVLPLLPEGPNYWDYHAGPQNPTGGLYSSAADLSKFLRYILTHYNALATGVNWLLPASWSTGMNSFYGMPWEIFRTDRILQHSKRPVTFATKSGGLPGYFSRILIMEEYGLGMTVLIGGEEFLMRDIIETVMVELLRATEQAIWRSMSKTHAGSFVPADAKLNTSLGIEVSESKGLHLTSFISNGTDVFEAIFLIFTGESLTPWFPQLTPTLLFEDEENQQGEIWRMVVAHEHPKEEANQYIIDDFCLTNIDMANYAGKPINKLIYWHEKGEVELPAWNITLRPVREDKQGSELLTQG